MGAHTLVFKSELKKHIEKLQVALEYPEVMCVVMVGLSDFIFSSILRETMTEIAKEKSFDMSNYETKETGGDK